MTGSTTDSPSESPSAAFSLVHGGPLYTLRRALRLQDEGRAALAFVVLAWWPLMVLAGVEWIMGRTPLIATDVTVHARLLLAIPLFFVAERSLHVRSGRCIDWFISQRWADGQDAAIRRAITGAGRLRDAVAPEVILIVLAAVGSQVVLRELAPFGVAREHAIGREWAPIKYWGGFISLPIYQFLACRWLWRWAIWCQLLWRLSRLRIKALATHPDRRGGLGLLSEPSAGFGYVLLGTTTVQAGVWANAILFAGADVWEFREEILVLLAGNLLLAIGPLLVFSGTLWRCRFDAILQYGRLATDYTRRFQRRWIERHDREDLLGTPDLQSLADLATSYDVIRQMRLVPVDLRVLLVLAAATLAPMVPLVLLEVPLLELLKNMGAVVLGV